MQFVQGPTAGRQPSWASCSVLLPPCSGLFIPPYISFKLGCKIKQVEQLTTQLLQRDQQTRELELVCKASDIHHLPTPMPSSGKEDRAQQTQLSGIPLRLLAISHRPSIARGFRKPPVKKCPLLPSSVPIKKVSFSQAWHP